MESGMRTTTKSKEYLNGLAKCIEKGVLHGSDLTSWKLAKEKGGDYSKLNTGVRTRYSICAQSPMISSPTVLAMSSAFLSYGTYFGGGLTGGET
jgi:hypothetical protein